MKNNGLALQSTQGMTEDRTKWCQNSGHALSAHDRRLRVVGSMKVLRFACVFSGFLSLALSGFGQAAGVISASAQVPPLIQFSNVATDEGGNPISGVANITVTLYGTQQSGEPLWTETQNNIQLDPTGHYSVQLGITKPNGLPTALFSTGEARLGFRPSRAAKRRRFGVHQ
jgi:hypothetical protein